MEIYFRATIDYDLSRRSIKGISFEYSLEDFDRNDKPVRGLYQYSSHTIPDYYSEKEAKALCEKMIEEFNVNGYSLSSTLSEQLEVKREFVESLKGYDRFKVVNSEVECINVSIFKVNKYDKSEDRLVDTIHIRVRELEGRTLNWFKLYSGVKLAPVYLEGDELYFLEDDGVDLKVIKKNGFAITYSDVIDDSVIATKIYCTSNRMVCR